MKFPKSARILKSSHFRRIVRNKQRLVGEIISIDFQYSKSYTPKLGITVSKKFGKAHDRNRFKRVVREAFREAQASLPIGLEVNVSPCKRLCTLSKQVVLSDLNRIVGKIAQNNSHDTISSS